MKNCSFLIIAIMFALQSCGPKKAAPEVSSVKNKIVLSAFNDMTTSSSFNIEALSDLPRTVDFSDKMTVAKNQGQRGTCTFFAAAGLIEAAIKIDKGIDVNISEEYLIYSTKNQGYYDDVEASHVSVNLQSVKDGGIVLEKDWSYIPSFFGDGKPCNGIDGEKENAPMECYVHSPAASVLSKVIPANSIKTGFIRKNTNEIIKYLAKNQRPLTISLPVNYKGWRNNGQVTYTEEMRQECLQNSSECGAHSVILTGYNLEQKIFYFKNSWGSDWGMDGFGTLSFEMVDQYVDGYLYYAKVDGDLAIPENFQEDNLNVKDLTIESSLTEDLNININLNNSNAGGRYIEIQNILAVIYIDENGDERTENIPMPSEESKEHDDNQLGYYLHSVGNTSQFARKSSMNIPGYLLQYPNVKAILELPGAQLVVLTGMFLYSDSSHEPVMINLQTTPVTR